MSKLPELARPQCISDVVGQDIITSIISKQIFSKSIADVYIFIGPPGVGKTSFARVMAHELNCDPCEINAAIFNSVGDVRELNKDASYHKIGQPYNFYIIDECHQYQKAGFSALLKLLEEPPENSIFVLCTTELQKIPKTILSRGQVFYFKSVKTEVIAERLGVICEDYKIDFDNDALDFIAASSHGCVRDAVQKLDQISSLGKVTINLAKQVIPDYDLTQKILLERDFSKLDDLSNSSVSVDTFIQDALKLAIDGKFDKHIALGLVKLRPFLTTWDPMSVIRCYLEGATK